MPTYTCYGNLKPYENTFSYPEQITVGGKIHYTSMSLTSGVIIKKVGFWGKGHPPQICDFFLVKDISYMPKRIHLIGDWV